MTSRVLAALAILVGACTHLETLSNAYSPFSRDLGVPVSTAALLGGGPPLAVSIPELIGQPATYHHARIRTDGYVTLQFEGNTLCPVKMPSGMKACLWLDVEGLADPGFRKGRGVVEGTFDGENLGHLGVASGTIGHITLVRRLK